MVTRVFSILRAGCRYPVGLSVACGSVSARTSESLALQPQTSKLQVTSKRQISSSGSQQRAATRLGEWPEPAFPSARVALPRPATPCGSAWPQGPLGSLRPEVFVRSSAREHPPGEPGHRGNAKNSGQARALEEETPRTVAVPRREKKKSRKRGFSGQTPRV